MGHVRPVSTRNHLCADPREDAPNRGGVPADLMVDLPAQPQRRDARRSTRMPCGDSLQAIAEGVSHREARQERALQRIKDALLGHSRRDPTTVEGLKQRLWQHTQETTGRSKASGSKAGVWECPEGNEADNPSVRQRQ